MSYIPVGVHPEQYEILRSLAKQNERSVAGEVRVALREYLRQQTTTFKERSLVDYGVRTRG